MKTEHLRQIVDHCVQTKDAYAMILHSHQEGSRWAIVQQIKSILPGLELKVDTGWTEGYFVIPNIHGGNSKLSMRSHTGSDLEKRLKGLRFSMLTVEEERELTLEELNMLKTLERPTGIKEVIQTEARSSSDKELRELDAWIAEHVMGWHWLVNSSKTRFIREFDGDRAAGSEPLWIHWDETLPRPTTDPAAAMLVLEKCMTYSANQFIYWQRGGNHIVSMQHWNGDSSIESDTLPIAICLFAKALFSK